MAGSHRGRPLGLEANSSHSEGSPIPGFSCQLLHFWLCHLIYKSGMRGASPGGPVVKIQPSNAEGTGSIPWSGN